jgi:Flp pilus assembly protein CpaB
VLAAIAATFVSASRQASSVVSRTRVVMRSPNSSGACDRPRDRASAVSLSIRSATPSSGSPQKSWTSASVAETCSAAAEAPPK